MPIKNINKPISNSGNTCNHLCICVYVCRYNCLSKRIFHMSIAVERSVISKVKESTRNINFADHRKEMIFFSPKSSPIITDSSPPKKKYWLSFFENLYVQIIVKHTHLHVYAYIKKKVFVDFYVQSAHICACLCELETRKDKRKCLRPSTYFIAILYVRLCDVLITI